MANTSRPTPTDVELVASSRAGDHSSFRQLVERHHDRLQATALGMLGPCPEVDEVVQETFIRFYRSIARFEGRSSLPTYLTRITMNEANKAIRRRQRWQSRFFGRGDADPRLPETATAPKPHPLETSERIERVRGAVQRLKPPFREVVVLRFLNECSTDECARILGIPPGTVMSRLTRALEKLSPMLKGENL